METVYVETTILSYLVSRPSRDIIVAARQELTREWWEYSKPGFECVLSQIVLDEISAGDPEHAAKRLDRASSLGAIAVDPSCLDLAQLYLDRGYVPKNEIRDALHIAVAVVWKVEYLLTWNCKHIANAHALRQLRKFSEYQGHEFPQVCTPEEL
jgi:hypothetical protein